MQLQPTQDACGGAKMQDVPLSVDVYVHNESVRKTADMYAFEVLRHLPDWVGGLVNIRINQTKEGQFFLLVNQQGVLLPAHPPQHGGEWQGLIQALLKATAERWADLPRLRRVYRVAN